VSSTPAPQQQQDFCFSCGFRFGHLVEGMDDALVGGLLVGGVLLLCCVICFCLGCWCCGASSSSLRDRSTKKYSRVSTTTTGGDEKEDA
jgi:hypothetical protein